MVVRLLATVPSHFQPLIIKHQALVVKPVSTSYAQSYALSGYMSIRAQSVIELHGAKAVLLAALAQVLKISQDYWRITPFPGGKL